MIQNKIKIFYEDNHLLVVEKPINIPTQADETGDPDLLTLLKDDMKLRHNKPGNVYLGLVHRLDRPVGGVMVFAKENLIKIIWLLFAAFWRTQVVSWNIIFLKIVKVI